MSATFGELTASAARLALVGLAKNTGKTEALAALLRERRAQGTTVGVTSVGRDGEERDAIDNRIEKPRVWLAAGSLVASTDALLRDSAIPYETVAQTGVRTPLGRVLVARLRGGGAIEVAGPSAAEEVRAVADAMLAHGAQQALIDGAIDRRAASSPHVADGLVMSTGAVLARDIEQVVAQTRDAVELVRLPGVDDAYREAADGERVTLPPRFALIAEPAQIERLLEEHPNMRWLSVEGALPERFLAGLLQPLRRLQRELTIVVSDPTHVFLSVHAPEWYSRQGVQLQARERIRLEAITVNPVAPRSHRFDSRQLRELLAETVPDVPIFDVLAE